MVAWTPYALLVVCVLLWGIPTVKARLDLATIKPAWPGLHQLVVRVPPVVAANVKDARYAAVYTLNWLTAPGTACLAAVLASAMVLRVAPLRLARLIGNTAKQLA